MELKEGLITRRSVRQFSEQQIDEAVLNELLEIASYAPSGMDRQSSRLVVVQNKAILEELEGLNNQVMNGKGHPFYGAPTVIFVFRDNRERDGYQDACCTMNYLLLAAHSLGLGSCWVSRAEPMFQYEKGQAFLKEWGLQDYTGVGCVVLGYPLKNHIARPKARVNRVVKIIKEN